MLDECSDECENTDGGYLCHCPPGFKLRNDKHQCTGMFITISYSPQIPLTCMEVSKIKVFLGSIEVSLSSETNFPSVLEIDLGYLLLPLLVLLID